MCNSFLSGNSLVEEIALKALLLRKKIVKDNTKCICAKIECARTQRSTKNVFARAVRWITRAKRVMNV